MGGRQHNLPSTHNGYHALCTRFQRTMTRGRWEVGRGVCCTPHHRTCRKGERFTNDLGSFFGTRENHLQGTRGRGCVHMSGPRVSGFNVENGRFWGQQRGNWTRGRGRGPIRRVRGGTRYNNNIYRTLPTHARVVNRGNVCPGTRTRHSYSCRVLR